MGIILVINGSGKEDTLLDDLLNEIVSGPGNVCYASEITDDLPNIFPEVVLLDIADYTEPATYEILRILTTKYIYAPVIVLSHKDNDSLSSRCIGSGAQDYLVYERLDAYRLGKAILHARERVHMNSEAAFARADYQRFFRESPMAMYIYDLETLEYLDANNVATNLYGYTREEFLDMTLLDMRPEEDKKSLREAMGDTSSLEGFYDFGYWRHQKKNGEIFHAHIYCHTTEFRGRKARLTITADESVRIETEKQNNELNRIIRQQKERMENILLSVNEIVWSSNPDNTQLTYINEACTNVYGYTPEELIGKTNVITDMVHPDDRERFIAAKTRMKEYGEAMVEYRMFHRSGEIIHIINQAAVRRDEEGNIIANYGVAIDITRIRKMEDDLQEKTNEVVRILESITEGFCALDNDDRFTYINSEFEKILEWKREHMMGSYAWDHFPDVFTSMFYQEYLRAKREKRSVRLEEYYPPLKKWFFIKLYPSSNGLAIFFRDITEEKKMEDRQFIDKQNLRALINNTQDLMWSIDTEYNIISVNNSFVDAMEQVIGLRFKQGDYILHEGFGSDELNRWRVLYDKVFAGEQVHITRRLDLVPGTEYTEINLNPIRNRKGQVIGIGCYSRDITQQQKYLARIEAQNKTLMEIAWIQSHKVRGPVATILGLEQLFNHQDITDPINAEIVSGISVVTKELDTIIKEIVTKTNKIDGME